MELHRFEKVWVAVSLLLIVGWIATVTYGAVGPPGIEMVNEQGGTIDPGSLNDHPRFGQPGVYEAPDGADADYRVYVVARQFLFQPGSTNPVEVPADSRVTFFITSGDVVHGFQLVGTNVNTMVVPGQVTQVTVEFDEPQTYGIVCHEYCGAAHHTMAGQLRVVPESQFTQADLADGPVNDASASMDGAQDSTTDGTQNRMTGNATVTEE